MNQTEPKYVKVVPSDQPSATATIQLAFGSSRQTWPAWFTGEAAHFRALKLENAFTAVSRHVRQGIWLGGGLVSGAQITHVGVPPQWSGRGYASSMIRSLFAELRNENIAVATGYPTTAAIYRRLGFDYAGTHKMYRMPIHHIPKRNSGDFRQIDTSDLAEVQELYSTIAPNRHGSLDRKTIWWESIIDCSSNNIKPLIFSLRKNGKCVGWTVLRPYTAVSPGRLTVDDWGCLPEYEEELLGLLRGWSTVAETASWTGPDVEPLSWKVPSNNIEVTSSQQWVLRVIDVKKAFSSRYWPINATGDLTFSIYDEVCPWNSGGWRISFSKGKASVGKLNYRPDTTVSPRALAGLLTGHTDPSLLTNAGLIRGLTENDSGLWRSALSGPKPWCADRY